MGQGGVTYSISSLGMDGVKNFETFGATPVGCRMGLTVSCKQRGLDGVQTAQLPKHMTRFLE